MSGVAFKSISGMNVNVNTVDTDIMPSVVAIQGMQLNFWSVCTNLSAMLLARDVSRVSEYDKRNSDTLAQIKKRATRFWTPWTHSLRRTQPEPERCWTKSTPPPPGWARCAKS